MADTLPESPHRAAREHELKGGDKLEVRAEILMSLNGRRRQLYIDPNVDLAAQRRTLGCWEWILPLTEPLPSRRSPAARVRENPAPGAVRE